MKTTDLSKVPRYGRANAVFVGATQYSGMRALLAHWPKWIRLRRRLKRAPGFCGHYVYYKFPFTFGQVVLFEEMDQMLRFARNKLHRELMSWIVEGDGKNARGGVRPPLRRAGGRKLRERALERRRRRGVRRAVHGALQGDRRPVRPPTTGG